VTYNSAENITASLAALAPEVERVGGEIIIYDNGSHDTTVSGIRAAFPKVRIIESARNLGFGAAVNEGAATAQGEFLLLANPDMIIDKGSIEILLAAIREFPSAGAVVARMRYPVGRFQPTCRQLPTPRNIFFSRGSFLTSGEETVSMSRHYTLGDFDRITPVPAASATCMLLEREFFLHLGGFDRRFFLFMEDTDLCLRIGQSGRKVYFVPTAGAVHHWGKGAGISSWRRNWYQHISVWKYFLKQYPNGFSLLLLPLLLLVNFLLKSIGGFRNSLRAW
jgi:GT2 family glycosyltransferase